MPCSFFFSLYESLDGVETTLVETVSIDNGLTSPPRDTHGLAMKCVKTFEASDLTAALQIRNDHYGRGPYVPFV